MSVTKITIKPSVSSVVGLFLGVLIIELCLDIDEQNSLLQGLEIELKSPPLNPTLKNKRLMKRLRPLRPLPSLRKKYSYKRKLIQKIK